jgi:hypothetical protein
MMMILVMRKKIISATLQIQAVALRSELLQRIISEIFLVLTAKLLTA